MLYNTKDWRDDTGEIVGTTDMSHLEENLKRPIGECTTNVFGSSVIFTCESGKINEAVYHNAMENPPLAEPDCSGEVMHVNIIRHGCNVYDWGDMLYAWENYCILGDYAFNSNVLCIKQYLLQLSINLLNLNKVNKIGISVDFLSFSKMLELFNVQFVA